jgi:hypothetical protein
MVPLAEELVDDYGRRDGSDGQLVGLERARHGRHDDLRRAIRHIRSGGGGSSRCSYSMSWPQHSACLSVAGGIGCEKEVKQRACAVARGVSAAELSKGTVSQPEDKERTRSKDSASVSRSSSFCHRTME